MKHNTIVKMMAGMIRKVKIQSSDTYDLCSDICV